MAETAVLEQPEVLNREPESLVRIRFTDCDPYRHLNNGRYLDYFINTREEHLEEYYGFDVVGDGTRENAWVVRGSQVHHMQSAVYNQRVVVQTRLLNFTANSLMMEGVMLNQEKTAILAVGWVEFRYIDVATGRPARHDEKLREFFETLHMDVQHTFGDERKRAKELKRILLG